MSIVVETEPEEGKKHIYILERPRLRQRRWVSQVMSGMSSNSSPAEKEEAQKTRNELNRVAEELGIPVSELVSNPELMKKYPTLVEALNNSSEDMSKINDIIFPTVCATLQSIDGKNISKFPPSSVEEIVEEIEYGDAFAIFQKGIGIITASIVSDRKKKESLKKSSELSKETETDTQPTQCTQ